MRERAETKIEDPQAKLERALMDEYLLERGTSLATLSQRPSDERRALMSQAAQYADMRLAEIDARAAYLHQLHDGTER